MNSARVCDCSRLPSALLPVGSRPAGCTLLSSILAIEKGCSAPSGCGAWQLSRGYGCGSRRLTRQAGDDIPLVFDSGYLRHWLVSDSLRLTMGRRVCTVALDSSTPCGMLDIALPQAGGASEQ